MFEFLHGLAMLSGRVGDVLRAIQSLCHSFVSGGMPWLSFIQSVMFTYLIFYRETPREINLPKIKWSSLQPFRSGARKSRIKKDNLEICGTKLDSHKSYP